MRKALLAAGIVALLVVLYAAAGYGLAPRYVLDALMERAAALGLTLEVADVRTDPFRLTVELDGLRLLAAGQELAQASHASADVGWASLWREGWVLQDLTLREPRAQVVLGPEGALNWRIEGKTPEKPAPAAAGETAEPGPVVQVERLLIEEGTVHFVDRSRGEPVEAIFEQVSAEATGLSNGPHAPGQYRLSARVASGGSVSSEGTVGMRPLAAQGRLTIAEVPLEKVWRLSAPASEPASGRVDGHAAYAYEDGRLALREVVLEGRLAHPEGIELTAIRLRSPEIALAPLQPFAVTGEATVVPAGRIAAGGTLAFAPFLADLDTVELAGLPLPLANRWLPEAVGATVASGTLSAQGHARIGVEAASYEGAIAVREARLEERASGELLVAWQALETDHASLALDPLRARLGEVRARGPAGRIAIDEQGRLNFAAVLPPDAPSGKEPGAEEAQTATLSVERLDIDEGTLHLVDRSQQSALSVTARALSGTVEGLSTAGEAPARVALKAPSIALGDAPAFSATASGTLAVQPLQADLKVAVQDVPLPQANRWVPQDVAVRIASGTLAGEGRLRFGGEAATYEGALAARGARLEARGTGELLLSWKSLETKEASLTFAPFSVQLGEVVAQAPAGRLIIGEDGAVNVAQIFQGGKAQDDATEPLRIAVRRLRLENGTLEFADHSLENDFAVTIRKLAGGITGFSTAPGNPARVQLAGQVQDYGEARIRGTINLDEPKSLANITANFRNIDLAALTPYIVRFAGYRVEEGRVSAELRYRVREGALVGENDLTFEEVQLGEKVQREGVKDLPLDLAVALLTDAQGRINLDIPVSGDLTDPQFDLGGLIARAIGNAIGRIASAPFRALAAVFKGGGRDAGDVRFAPGAVALSPPAREDVDRLAQALQARPRLELAIRGGYDPQADARALRRDAARRAIAARAGVEGGAPLDFSDPKVLAAAENLYMDRVGTRLELQALRGGETPYARAVLEALAQTLPVDDAALQNLARARAEAVRAALAERGVAPARLSVAEPVHEEAEKEGVATQLALQAQGRAAAGGTR